MVRVIILALLLSACANTDKPKFGKQVEAPYGWKYTYCPSHLDELVCNDVQ